MICIDKNPDAIITILEKQGVINRENADKALRLYQSEPRNLSLLAFITRLELASEIQIAEIQAKEFGLEILNEDQIPDYPIEDLMIPTEFLKSASLLPIDNNENELILAVADATQTESFHAVQLAYNKQVNLMVSRFSYIDNAIDKLYGEKESSMSELSEEIGVEGNKQESDSTEKLKNLASEAPIIRLVNIVISRAIEARASDIHIEPFDNKLNIRYRIDGVLIDTESPPAKSSAAVISRLKIMAKLNIAERRLPQDGRIQLRNQGKLIDLRVSTVPTQYGESVVLRILDKQRIELSLNALGFDQSAERNLIEVINKPYGIFLVTGPTGSGKSTTLYAALQYLNTAERKILTVEDPVEYQIEGINQIQVRPNIGLDFADALRSIVRQDPDVIMIGEMRDLGTARIAVQSALTGHLVLSTLHTNDSGSSITRLLDMGIEDYLLTSTLNGILAQRLVRKLCNQCKEAYRPSVQVIEETGLAKLQTDNDIVLHHAMGCNNCTHTGYYGRSVITELLKLSENIRQHILEHADSSVIQSEAIKSGMRPMRDDGLIKATQGITTIEEVTRVTQDA